MAGDAILCVSKVEHDDFHDFLSLIAPDMLATLGHAGDGNGKVAVTFDPRQLLRFLLEGFPPMNDLWDQAQMTERRIYDRSNAVFEYFGLPFDSPPPL